MAIGLVATLPVSLFVAAGSMNLGAAPQSRGTILVAAENTAIDSTAFNISGTQSSKAPQRPKRDRDKQPGDKPLSTTTVVDPALPTIDPLAASISVMLADPAFNKSVIGNDLRALQTFYADRYGRPVWVEESGFSAKAKALIQEIKMADDWGLSARDYKLPRLTAANDGPEALAEAEIKLSIAALAYARHARGGRTRPSRISPLFDQEPPLRHPSVVLAELATAEAPDTYLKSLHPKHVQFERLRQALVKARDKKYSQELVTDDASSVTLPATGSIVPGARHADVALLRQRLKMPAERGKEDLYDAKLQRAVKAFQERERLLVDGIVGSGTRAALNGNKKPHGRGTKKEIQRLLVNMERWRWMPEELGELYVWDNVPEYKTRIIKNDKTIHTDTIIVGQPSWATPVFSADMRTIVFQPEWYVPNGIKVKELLPLLRKSSTPGFFGFFGGGYSSRAVLEAYDLKASYKGRVVDPDQVDWQSANIRTFRFTQPPGPKNVLGDVKFLFPNKHAVYMHDTPQRELFGEANLALSHGCMRIEDPLRFAQIILGLDKGWSRAKVANMMSGGYNKHVALSRPFPVHVTYFTARVDDNGNVKTFGDLYGLDTRVAKALFGTSVRFDAPPPAAPAVADNGAATIARTGQPRKTSYEAPTSLADAVSGLMTN